MSSSLWWIWVVGLIGVALIAVAVWRWRKSKAKGAPAKAPDKAAEEEEPIVDVWRRLEKRLPESARDGSIVLVLGERLSGKTTLIRAALGSDPLAGLVPGGGDDARLAVYAGRGQIVLELSADMLADARAATADELDKLWRDIALRGLRVVVTLNVTSPAWSSEGLGDLARSIRRVLDRITSMRGAPVHVRACVTHLDRRTAGFQELNEILHTEGVNDGLSPPAYDRAALRAALDPWTAFAPLGVKQPEFSSIVGFMAKDGPDLLGTLAPFFQVLLATSGRPPVVDGLVLAASPPDVPPCLAGDPLAVDTRSAEGDARRLMWRRIAQIAIPAAAALVLLGLVAAWDNARTNEAAQAVSDLKRAFAEGRSPAERRAVEEKAASAVTAIGPPYWPLFAGKKEKVVTDYLQTVHDNALLPRVKGSDRSARIRATATLYGVTDDELAQRAVDGGKPWADSIGVAEPTVGAYVGLARSLGELPSSLDPATSVQSVTLDPIAPASKGTSRSDWAAYLAKLDAAQSRSVVNPCRTGQRKVEEPCESGSLFELSREGTDLEKALEDAASQNELGEVVAELSSDGVAVQKMFGSAPTSDASRWMVENATPLRQTLTIVRTTSLATPDATGKNLREVTEDLRAIAAAAPSYSEAAPAASTAAAPTSTGIVGKLTSIFGTPTAAASTLPSALPSALASAVPSGAASAAPSGSASTSSSAAAAPSTSASSSAAAEPTDPVYTVTLDGQRYAFDTGRWSNLVVASRASLYLNDFSTDVQSTKRSPFFRQNASYAPSGASLTPGRGPSRTIEGTCTATAFRKDVAPGITGIGPALDAARVPDDRRQTMDSQLRRASTEHGQGCRKNMLDYYKSFTLSAQSASALRADVSDMVSATSFLADFLWAVAEAANIGSPEQPNTYWQAIGDSLADFNSVILLMAKDKNKYPNLEKYYAILAPLLPSIDSTPPFNVAKGAALEDRLAPIGKLALSAAREPKTAPHAQIEAYLDGQGIPSDLRSPFFAAIVRAYALGRADIERAVEQAWERDVLPGVMPLLERFPFNPQSDIDASATDVETTFGPKGTFFDAFNTQIAPACIQTSPGIYHGLDMPVGGGSGSGTVQLNIPRGALRLVHWATRLQAILFAADGKPRPIPYQVQPQVLPSLEPVRTVTLGYIRASTTTVYGFNQTPAWQAFGVPWAVPDTASVGIRTMPTGGGEPRDQSIDAGTSSWSFFRLLQRGTVDGKRAVWTLTSPEPGSPQRAVTFLFDVEPWTPFRAQVVP